MLEEGHLGPSENNMQPWPSTEDIKGGMRHSGLETVLGWGLGKQLKTWVNQQGRGNHYTEKVEG